MGKPAAYYREYRTKNAERLRAYQRDYYQRDLERSRANRRRSSATHRATGRYRAWRLKAEFGITPAEYEAMLVVQGGRCAICFQTPNTAHGLVVDHDHSTGAVRGLLCQRCNLGIGGLRDDPAVVRQALAYLTAPDA